MHISPRRKSTHKQNTSKPNNAYPNHMSRDKGGPRHCANLVLHCAICRMACHASPNLPKKHPLSDKRYPPWAELCCLPHTFSNLFVLPHGPDSLFEGSPTQNTHIPVRPTKNPVPWKQTGIFFFDSVAINPHSGGCPLVPYNIIKGLTHDRNLETCGF